MPSSARRSSAPRASRSLAAQTAVNGAAPASSVSIAERAALAVEARAHDETLVEREAGLGQTAAIALEPLARDVQRRRAGQEGDLAVPRRDELGDHAGDAGRVVDADVGLAEGVGREVDDGRAVARIAATCLRISSFTAGSSRPLPAKMSVAARIERSRRTYEFSRSAIAVGAAGDDQEAAAAPPRPRRRARPRRSTGR